MRPVVDLRDAGVGIFDTAAGTRQFLIDLVASERRSPHLPDGLIARMVADHGADFDDVELGGLARLVANIRDIERALGDGIKRVHDSELSARQKLRRIITPLYPRPDPRAPDGDGRPS